MKNKRTKHIQQKIKEGQARRLSLSKTGLKIGGIGVVVAVLGYGVLSYVDPAGQNWASVLAPFLILGGYILIGLGIVTPDTKDSSPLSNR